MPYQEKMNKPRVFLNPNEVYYKPEIYEKVRLKESYWPGDQSRSLLDWTIGEALRKIASEVPDRVALVEAVPETAKRRRWTYAEMLTDAERVASALLARFNPGDRIAIWGDSVPEWLLTQLGCVIAGMAVVTINPAYKLKEAEYILRQSESSSLFSIEEYRGNHILATAKKIKEMNLPFLKEVVSFSDFDDFMNSASKRETFPEVKPKDCAMIFYTSGTTGLPKGAMLHHRGLVNYGFFEAERMGMQIGGVWANAMPLCHFSGSVVSFLASLMRAGTHILIRAWDPLKFIEVLESERCTDAFLVPTQVEALVNNYNPEKHRVFLRNILSGASFIEARLVKKVSLLFNGCRLATAYGQTETHGAITMSHGDDATAYQTDTVGQPFPLIELKISDTKTGKVLPLNTVGEICMRGYQAMLGYYKKPEENAKTLDNDGWIHTGDLGTMDERGFLKITGRLKEMIIRGGLNIYPIEVESLLSQHPKIEKVAVVGVPDQYWGEQVGAVIMLKSSENRPTLDELIGFCRDSLAAFKVPKLWYYVEDLPCTATGKTQKYELIDKIVKSELTAAENMESHDHIRN
ncbi:MAG: AMP-binding protein [Desulfobacterales bacterium]|jgi:fatty-acyl-CoA synthase|nr:AMP-binding protein [Desulfobacterales bacterium]